MKSGAMGNPNPHLCTTKELTNPSASPTNKGRRRWRERIERVVEDFDVVNDTMGNPVKNPLMHVRDVKNLIISRLKEQPHEHK